MMTKTLLVSMITREADIAPLFEHPTLNWALAKSKGDSRIPPSWSYWKSLIRPSSVMRDVGFFGKHEHFEDYQIIK